MNAIGSIKIPHFRLAVKCEPVMVAHSDDRFSTNVSCFAIKNASIIYVYFVEPVSVHFKPIEHRS